MRYGYKIDLTQVNDHIFWIVESTKLKGCVAQGDTPEEALQEFEENENEWLESAKKYGISIPEPVPAKVQEEYSGKFTVRLSKGVHHKLAERAEDEGVSINQFVCEAICERIGKNETVNELERQLESIQQAIKDATQKVSWTKSKNRWELIEMKGRCGVVEYKRMY